MRTLPCEVFVNSPRAFDGNSPALLNMTDFFGYYTFMESVKRGRERVPIERLSAGDVAELAVTGGYIFKIDRLGPGESGFELGGGITNRMVYVEPKEIEIAPQQGAWLRTYLGSFVSALRGSKLRRPGQRLRFVYRAPLVDRP